jgi:hypothetical protein
MVVPEEDSHDEKLQISMNDRAWDKGAIRCAFRK